MKATVERSDFLNQIDPRSAAVLEGVMVGYDQAGPPEEEVERKVFQTMESVSSRKNLKIAVVHDSDAQTSLIRVRAFWESTGTNLVLTGARKSLRSRTSGHAEENAPCGKTMMDLCWIPVCPSCFRILGAAN